MKLFREMLLYAVLMAVIGLLSVWPRYELIEDDRARETDERTTPQIAIMSRRAGNTGETKG